MLFLLYNFNEAIQMGYFEDCINAFFKAFAIYPLTTITKGNNISVTIEEVPTGYTAMQIIDTIDVMIEARNYECELIQFCYTDKHISNKMS